MKKIFYLLLFFFFFETSFSQAFYHLQLGRSVASIGTGEQHLTLLDPVNAMAGNPANLIYEDGITISLFRNPLYFFFGKSIPITNALGSFNYKNKHFFGIEYSSWDFGKFIKNENGIEKEMESYEKSFSLGYAQKLNDKLSIGSKITYGIQGDIYKAKHLMFSAGLSLREKLFNKDLVMGLSFMNFGNRVKVKSETEGEFYAENPSSFIIGLNYNLISTLPGNIFYLLEFDKGIMSYTNGVPDNSFKSFIKSWKKFDQNLNTRMGFVLSSNPVNILKTINFNSKYFIGYSTERYSGEFYNYGMQLSFSNLDYSLILGFGGRLFSGRNFLSPAFYGYETFDITLNKKIDWSTGNREHSKDEIVSAKDLSISFGISSSLPLGIWKSNYVNTIKTTTENFLSYDLDFEVRLNDYISAINTFSYWRSKMRLESSYFSPIVIEVDNYAILSGISLSPFKSINNFFISTKIGVLRSNPIPSNVYPKYNNSSMISLSTGYKLNLFNERFQLIPFFNFVTFFSESSNEKKDEVFGLKKLDFGLKFGYKF